MLRTGLRDRKITIQRATITTSDLGEAIKSWTTHFQAWAAVTFISGSEMMKSGREVSSKAATFTIPFTSNLKTSDRIFWGNEIWDIENIRELGRRQGIQITAVVNEEEVGG